MTQTLAIFDHGPMSAPCPTPFNLAAHVLAQADQQPDKVALAVLGPEQAQNWTYARLKSAILGTGTGLLNAGFKPGDILLMRLGNTVEFPIAYLGAIAVGLVPVPTSSQLTAPEVARMIDQLSPAGILRDPAIACPVVPDIAMLDLTQLEAMHDLPDAAFDMGDPDRLAYVIYTSGTSGNPRPVAHAHRAIWARQMMHRDWYDLHRQDRMLHAGAFNWTYTLGTGLMDPWSVGATALIPAPGTAPEQLPQLIAQHKASIFAAAPGVYRKFLKSVNKLELPSLRHGLAAGEKLSDGIRAAWNAATGLKIYEAFGMSECSTFISASPACPARAGCLGRPQPGRRVAIVDENGPVETGGEGVIAIDRTDPGLMLGYLGAPDETRARMQGDWFLTGDLGSMAADGQITYLGRRDDMMNAGGYRVSPLEVEAALHDFPGLGEFGVCDVEIKPDIRIIVGFYTGGGPDHALDADALAVYAQSRLARYKQPRAYIHMTALPSGPNGKLSRRALRAHYEATHGQA